MNVFQAAVLGIVQGLSEFLPISSSGHLVLVQEYFGISEGAVAFDVFLHFATLLAVVLYFRDDLFRLTKKQLMAILIATIPAAVVGLFLEEYIIATISSLVFLGVTFIVTGIFNIITEYKLIQKIETKKQVGSIEALVIGLFQALAVLPGISRSSATVFASVVQNVERKASFHFSFLISIPVIFGANLIYISRIVNGEKIGIDIAPLFVGGALAFIVGFLSLKLLEIVIVKAKMNYFGFYCIALGLLVIAFNW